MDVLTMVISEQQEDSIFNMYSCLSVYSNFLYCPVIIFVITKRYF